MKAPLLASIDIGSNSVLLLVGRVINGKLHTELQRKETIRLGGALDSERNLEPSAMERGIGMFAPLCRTHRPHPPCASPGSCHTDPARSTQP